MSIANRLILIKNKNKTYRSNNRRMTKFLCYKYTFSHNFRGWDNAHDTILSENLARTLCGPIDGKQQGKYL